MIIGSIVSVAWKSIFIMYYEMRIHRKRAILICGGQLKPSLENHNGQWCQTIEEQAEAFAIDLERRFRLLIAEGLNRCSIDKLICLTHRAIIIIYGMLHSMS
ncbi:hypothetical protein ACLKA6_007330 [Drosophila palustris]